MGPHPVIGERKSLDSHEFEMYPGWVAGVVTPWCSPGITLKGIRFVEFDQSVSWAAKVRNVSRLGSQIRLLIPLILTPAK